MMDGYKVVLNDSGATVPGDAAYIRRNGDDLVYKDPTAAEEVPFSELGGGVDDHGALTGLADDDHSQYQTAARHTAAHDATYNNALAISGDSNGQVTLGAHVSDAAVHFVRPAQMLTVAKGGTGQYATIAAALAVANAAASEANPYLVQVYPGVYDENQLTVGDYVSLSSVIPGQAVIAPTSGAYGVLILSGNCTLSGLYLNLPTMDNNVITLPTITATVRMFDCIVMGGSITTLKNLIYHATATGSLTFEAARCTFRHGGRLIKDTADSASSYLLQGCQFIWDGKLTSAGQGISINTSQRVVIRGCQFDSGFVNTAPGNVALYLKGTSTTTAMVESCEFKSKLPTGGDLRVIESDGSMTVSVRNCRIHPPNTGTQYDLYANSPSVIETGSSVWEPDRQGGNGTIRQLVEGDVAVRNLAVNGSVSGIAMGRVRLTTTLPGTLAVTDADNEAWMQRRIQLPVASNVVAAQVTGISGRSGVGSSGIRVCNEAWDGAGDSFVMSLGADASQTDRAVPETPVYVAAGEYVWVWVSSAGGHEGVEVMIEVDPLSEEE